MTWTLAALDGGTTLLTVNNRLAVELRARYDRAQLAAGRRVWPSADILPFGAWLGRLYQQLLDSGFTELDLLSPAQERLLWQDIIEQQAGRAGLLRPAAAAESAQAAHALLTEWQLENEPLDLLGGDETRTFLGWRHRFNAELARRGLLSAAQLLPLLTSAFGQRALPVPARLVHSGFDALSPAQLGLFDVLRAAGCTIQPHQAEKRAGSTHRVEAVDGEAEIRLAAQWARAQLQQDPARRIGIVSPRIAQQRRDLERLFGEILTPAGYLTNSSAQAVFNLSLGEPLSERPLVAHALLALRLLTGPQPLNAIGQLLRSPFLGGHGGEWERRALLDAALREDGLPLVDLARLGRRLAHFEPGDPRHCPDLAARLDRLQAVQRQLPASATPQRWAEHFQALLDLLGWPGDRALDSHEFQQRERLQRVFSELAELGKVRPRMRLGQAVSQFCALAAAAVFQPRSPPTPIQILGPLEAAGMDFDALWLLGMDDQVWPPPPGPNPLLPTRLQRDLGMPHASAARELAFATTLTERLAHSAAQVIASHARTDAEREQRPSPLLRDWTLLTANDLVAGPAAGMRAACAAPGRFEPLPAAAAGTAPAGQRGGAALLQAQANCPFQAVARFRLNARPLDEASFAADGALLGNLVHELLQRVWQQLGDSARLAQHDDAALQGLIEPLARATLEDIGRRRPDLFTPRFRSIEATRLTLLAIDWLNLERRRSQAFAVLALEQDRDIELAGLQLRTRADRVDRLADGSLAVIDYKTGQSVRNDGWFDDRLSEPQLPLYCVHSEGEVQAALLARVRRDRPGCTFVGLSRDQGFAPGVDTPQARQQDTDWDGILAHWRRALGDLAAEIHSGRADPTPSLQACRYCALGALCRVQQMLAEDNGE